MKVNFSLSLLADEWLLKVFQGYAQKCDLAVRKAALPVAKRLEKLAAFYKRTTAELNFKYGQPAPANYPNAGARIIEAGLMNESDWKEYLTELDALNERVEEVDWLDVKPDVEIPANVLKRVLQGELEASEVFFNIVEGPEDPAAEPKKK